MQSYQFQIPQQPNRGIDISHETVRFWWSRFGPMFAAEIRKRRIYQRDIDTLTKLTRPEIMDATGASRTTVGSQRKAVTAFEVASRPPSDDWRQALRELKELQGETAPELVPYEGWAETTADEWREALGEHFQDRPHSHPKVWGSAVAAYMGRQVGKVTAAMASEVKDPDAAREIIMNLRLAQGDSFLDELPAKGEGNEDF